MHRMNANRPTTDGTSTALSDKAVQNIKEGMDLSIQRRASKRQANKKIALVVEAPVEEVKEVTLKVASINEIPSNFERIGSGFFRQGHHLWELNPSDKGFVLVRKHGEDHVLGYDVEPIVREADIIYDRDGKSIKVGSRVTVPHHGKLADATVILISPQSLGLETDVGEKIDAAPDMVQLLEQMMLESIPVAAPVPIEIEMEEIDLEEEDDEDDEENNKSKGEGMEPGVEPSSKSAQINDLEPTLTTEPIDSTEEQGRRPIEEEVDSNQEYPDSRLMHELRRRGSVIVNDPSTNQTWAIKQLGEDQFTIYAQKFEKMDDVDTARLIEFESNLGSFKVVANTIPKQAFVDHSVWNDYWRSVGKRVAQANMPASPKPISTGSPTPVGPKPKTPKLPKRVDSQEQKEKKKQTRKERRQTMKGLPPGTKVPPRTPIKISASDDDDRARDKEYVRACDQLVDALTYVIEDDKIRDQPELLADNLMMELEEHKKRIEELDTDGQEELEDELSIETPPKNEKSLDDLRAASKISISMSSIK